MCEGIYLLLLSIFSPSPLVQPTPQPVSCLPMLLLRRETDGEDFPALIILSLTVFNPSRTTQFRCRMTCTTLPCFPASLPSKISTCKMMRGQRQEIVAHKPSRHSVLMFSPCLHRIGASLHQRWALPPLGAACSMEDSSSCLRGSLDGSSHSGSGEGGWLWMPRPAGPKVAWSDVRNLTSERLKKFLHQL